VFGPLIALITRDPLGNWQHTPHPFLIRFGEDAGIRYYGLAYLLGFAAAVWLLRRYRRAVISPLDANAIWDLITYLVAGVLVGGRLGYFLLYQPGSLVSDPLGLFRVWEGGMASHGGFLGVILALLVFARSRRLPFLQVSDLVVTTVPLGLGLGRVANFLNGELWGRATTVPWAVTFASSGGGDIPRHPSQLYEALLEGFLLFALMQWRLWSQSAARRVPGRLSGEFLVAYAVARIVCELFREPDAGLILGVSRGIFYSFFVAISGIAVLATRRNSEHKT
jgi:phosphatidylglycerol:prolipoprotein diacylglycerol transferase